MDTSSLESISEKTTAKRQSSWMSKRRLITGGIVLALVVLAIALGVGLGVGLHSNDSNDAQSPTTKTTAALTGNITSNSNGVWQPTAGTTWNYELYAPLTQTATDGIQVWGLDLYDNAATTITGLQSGGAKVICYFSAGSYENWRPDASNFSSSDLGKELDGWAGEKWLDTTSQNVRNIMLARLDLAVSKNCNGVDPDNMDGYENDTGFNLTQANGVDYVTFLAEAAHQRNLAIGLKNAGDIIPDVIDLMQWSINEQCEQYDECDTFEPFIQQGKPVFHVEYPKGDNTNNNDAVSASVKTKICNDTSAAGFSTIIKNIRLDSWLESC